MAYNSRYQYETSPRKLQPEYERVPKKYPKKSTVRKANVNKKAKVQPKKQIKNQAKIMLYVAFGFIILFAISYRKSKISRTISKRNAGNAKIK